MYVLSRGSAVKRFKHLEHHGSRTASPRRWTRRSAVVSLRAFFGERSRWAVSIRASSLVRRDDRNVAGAAAMDDQSFAALCHFIAERGEVCARLSVGCFSGHKVVFRTGLLCMFAQCGSGRGLREVQYQRARRAQNRDAENLGVQHR